MEQMQERDFINSHKCNAGVQYTDWRLIDDRNYKHNLPRA